MKAVANVLTGLVALSHVGFLVLEARRPMTPNPALERARLRRAARRHG